MMELVRGVINLSEAHKNCVLTIGNFDGVHLGHQYVLGKLKQASEQYSLPAVVLLFEPQPEEFFLQDKAAARILTFREKYQKLSTMGIDRLICVRFNQAFAGMEPEAFIKTLLVEKLGVKHLIVGDDFRFGRKRAGDFQLLSKKATEYGFQVEDSQTLTYCNNRASSTEIRKYLEQSDFSSAAALLSSPFKLNGKVIHGAKNGRKFGFPTANIALRRKVLPLRGVFVVKVEWRQ